VLSCSWPWQRAPRRTPRRTRAPSNALHVTSPTSRARRVTPASVRRRARYAMAKRIGCRACSITLGRSPERTARRTASIATAARRPSSRERARNVSAATRRASSTRSSSTPGTRRSRTIARRATRPPPGNQHSRINSPSPKSHSEKCRRPRCHPPLRRHRPASRAHRSRDRGRRDPFPPRSRQRSRLSIRSHSRSHSHSHSHRRNHNHPIRFPTSPHTQLRDGLSFPACACRAVARKW